MITHTLRVLLSVGLVTTSLICSSQQLRVELIVFQQSEQRQAKLIETWPEHPGLPNSQGAIELSKQGNYRMLNSSNLLLKDVATRINAQKNMRTIAHLAWQQPAKSMRRAKPIHISAGKSYVFQSNGTHALRELSGIVKISQSKFPHISVDLLLREPESHDDTHRISHSHNKSASSYFEDDSRWQQSKPILSDESYSGYRTYRLKQQQRLKPGKINYIDHPLLGIIILVKS